MTYENELDKLRDMLDQAGIPYESEKELWAKEIIEKNPDWLSGNKKYFKNQIIYDRDGIEYKIDGICQYGSYGVNQGLIETYGALGVDEYGSPMVLTAEEVFEIIKNDWEVKHDG